PAPVVQVAQQQAPAVPATPSAPASAPAAAGKAFFEITVAPKEAAIEVDGKTVSAGRVEVSSDENHKVTATCQGYKPVGQYYRVKPGETRKIDLLLEKEIKRSLFGF
ncbi:MAG: hypothetical protein PHV28_06550, partial [Kiritimatiellae bacterium]|nr:hypothetical protein [Kiritimatiellia bacterium]